MKVTDSGGYGVDGTLSGTYTIDSTKKIIIFGADGELDTGFVLPTAAHIIVETYDIDGTSGALDYHFFKRDTDDVNTYLASCQALVDAEVSAGRYTTYKMKATHYKGSDKADVYDADESTSFPTTADYTDLDYTPSTSSWKITDTLTAPTEANLLVNGDFETGDTTGFTAYNATLSVVSKDSHTNCLQVADSGSWSSGYQLISNVSVGDQFRLTYDYINESTDTDNGNIVVGTDAGSNQDLVASADYTTDISMSGFGSQSIEFTVTSETYDYFYVKCTSMSTLNAWFDNIKLVKIN